MDGKRRFGSIRAVKFETLKNQQEKKNKRRRAFYIFLVVAAALSFFVVVFTVLLKISDIEITGTSVYTEEEILSALSVSKGDSLYGFDEKAVANTLKHRFPYIKSISVDRILPSTLVINITDETPVFAIQVERDYFILSDDFKVLERRSALPEDIKLVFLNTGYVKRCVTGETLSFAETRLLLSLDELWATLCHYKLDGKIDYIQAYNRFDIYFGYNNGQLKTYLGDIKDCDAKIRFFIGIKEHLYDDQRGNLDISSPREATFSPASENSG